MSSRGRGGGILLPSGAVDIPVGALHTHRHRQRHSPHRALRLQGSDCKVFGKGGEKYELPFYSKLGQILFIYFKTGILGYY